MAIIKSLAFALVAALFAGGVFDAINVLVRMGLDGEGFLSSVCLLNGPGNGCGGILLFYGIMFVAFFVVALLRFVRKK